MLTHTVAPTRPAPVVLAEPFLAKWMLIGVAVLFLALFLLLPLAAIFVQAFDSGLAGYWAAISEAEALSAFTLTLIAASVAVPLNLIFGVAAAWAVTRFSFRGKQLLVALDRPALCRVAGRLRPGLRAALRHAGLLRTVAEPTTTSRSSSPSRGSCSRRCSSACRSSPGS